MKIGNSQFPFFSDTISERPMTRPEIAKDPRIRNSEDHARRLELSSKPKGSANA
jgi:hypothetical protein